MSSATAFSGSYCDMRFVKSRKVAQIVVEIPIEQAAAFVAAFGALAAAAETIDALDALFHEHVDPISDDMTQFDYEQAMAFYRQNERRFAP